MGNARIKRDGGKQGNGGARDAVPKVVLVGTYRGDQLVRWRGWYCWPMAADAAMQNAGCRMQNDGLAQINELWLFRGTAEQKTYKAEFVGVKTRDELIHDHGYPAKGKAHAEHYALFKTELLYRHKNDLPEEADAVIIRTKDFATSPKVRKQLKAYLESPDRRDPDLAKLLPSIVTKLAPERLRVCEGAIQLSFADLFHTSFSATPSHTTLDSLSTPVSENSWSHLFISSGKRITVI